MMNTYLLKLYTVKKNGLNVKIRYVKCNFITKKFFKRIQQEKNIDWNDWKLCSEFLWDYILVESEPPVRMSLIEMFPISSRIIDGPASLRISSDRVVFTAIHLHIYKMDKMIQTQSYETKHGLSKGMDF